MYEQLRECITLWTEGSLSDEVLDTWPVDRVYRFADSYIDAHTVEEKKDTKPHRRR